MPIKITTSNEKLEEACDILVEKVNAICKQFTLNYFEIVGIMDIIKYELIQSANEIE